MQEVFSRKPKSGEPWDVIIIGSGPSALTAAIYTTRGAASTLIIAGETWGGQLMLTTTVDNFPGFPQGIEGPELMTLMRTQATRFGGEWLEKNATAVDFLQRPFKVIVGDTQYLARSVIVATGAETKWLGIPGEVRLRGRGISSCAPCDAPFFKGKTVAVVGGGDSAMEEALVLSKYASKVYLIHRRDTFRASQAMQAKVKSIKKIEIIWDTEVLEAMGEHTLEKLKLQTKGKPVWELALSGLFVAIGHDPATRPFAGQLNLDMKGYITPKPQNHAKSATGVEGIFVAGDVHDYYYKQAITAAAFGCMAAMDALHYLDQIR